MAMSSTNTAMSWNMPWRAFWALQDMSSSEGSSRAFIAWIRETYGGALDWMYRTSDLCSVHGLGYRGLPIGGRLEGVQGFGLKLHLFGACSSCNSRESFWCCDHRLQEEQLSISSPRKHTENAVVKLHRNIFRLRCSI